MLSDNTMVNRKLVQFYIVLFCRFYVLIASKDSDERFGLRDTKSPQIKLSMETTYKRIATKGNDVDCLVYSSREGIDKMCLSDTDNPTRIVHVNHDNIPSIDIDFQNKCVYYSEISSTHSAITKVCLEGSGKSKVILESNFTLVEGLAFDWTSNNIYWVARNSNKLGVTSNDGNFSKTLYEGTELFDKPRSIVLHPALGLLFWTDWSDSNPRITRASMTGDPESVNILIQGIEKLVWVNGLTLDYERSTLYWTDAKLDSIGSVQIDGSGFQVAVKLGKDSHPFGIALSQEYLYWTDWQKKGIFQTSKDEVNIISSVKHNEAVRLMALEVWAPKPAVNITGNMSCKQLWLPFYNNTTKRVEGRCYCGDDFQTLTMRDNEIDCQRIEENKPKYTENRTTNENTCSSEKFQCLKSKNCIPSPWICDGQNDCSDGSDENSSMCGNVTCSTTEFSCLNSGKCIPMLWRCDGATDCTDASDENCTDSTPTCTKTQFQCGVTKECVNIKWRCDGDTDCSDGTDEDGCGSKDNKTTCGPGFVSCGNDSMCVPERWVCDGDTDCPNGSDEMNCTKDTETTPAAPKTVRFDDCLVYTTRNEIRRVCPYNNTYEIWLTDHDAIGMLDVDIDHTNRCVFFAAGQKGNTFSVKEHCRWSGTRRVFVTNMAGGVEGIAYDWIHENLYWLDTRNKQLIVTDRAGRFYFTLYQGDIFDAARDLVLHPTKGLLFWSDWSSTQPAITRASMAGDETTVKRIVTGADLEWPNGLALDRDNDHIYWVDAKLDKIKRCGLDGEKIIVVCNLNKLSQPYGLAVSEKYIYWSSWKSSSIQGISKDPRSTEPAKDIVTGVYVPNGLAVFPRNAYRPNSSRWSCPLDCPHLCLVGNTGNETSFACRCSEGFDAVSVDDRTYECVQAASTTVDDPDATETTTSTRIQTRLTSPKPTNFPCTTTTHKGPTFPFRTVVLKGDTYTELVPTCSPLRLHRLCPLNCFIQVDQQTKGYCFKCHCP